MKLAEQILSLFRGRGEYIAVANGSAFAPAAESPSVESVERHLTGEQGYGFYLMREDNTILCTCVDFDNKPEHPNPEYENQALALCAKLMAFGLSPLLERSQSGSGYHVWLFFSRAVDAFMVRAWWRGVEANMGVKFVEVFPKQDTLTGKGMGNLVRFPLWNKSAFIDFEDEMAIMDPAEALDSCRLLEPEDLPLLAFQLGMGELRADPKPSIATVAPVGAPVDGMLPLRVQKLLERKGSLFQRRWGGDTMGMKDPSRSAVGMSLCTEMVRMYVPTPEIASALRYWMRSNGSEKAERDDWVQRTVTSAYDFVLTRTEAQSQSETTMEKASLAYIDLLASGAATYLGSGIPELDASIDGAAAGEMIVIAGRPGHGKSAFAFQWLTMAAQKGIRGLAISEEMSDLEVGKRHLLSVSGLDQQYWDASVANELRKDVTQFHQGKPPVFLVNGCGTIDRVEEVIDQFVSLHGIGIAAVDYLQLLTGRFGGDRYEVVTELSRRLKRCAARNRIPILVLSQLNREVEKRTDNEPKLSDLRESGQIEQDADMVLFVQWPYKFDQTVNPHLYRIYCGKRRNGPIRVPRVETNFNPARQTIGVYAGG